ncbi:MAG TPA: PSD1 and planctomycete cytochrome C domain-containing protein [Bryobacteraceae bacterium]|nr:PSD1 and planctomycete cytochrome C domain-containing protein [Bryobacteraceae bacterium]
MTYYAYACLFALTTVPLLAQKADDFDFFEKKIRPVLAESCYGCHSAASKPPQGGLQVDSRDGLRRGGGSGPAVVPKDPSKSLLLAALKQSGALKMPPGKPLSPEVVADFETWITMGAPDPRSQPAAALPPPYDFEKARRHWSYQPVRDPEPPKTGDPLWSKTSIDRFIKAKLDEKGLKPVGPAGKRTLIRRATFDLTGLPPAPEDVDAFVKDVSPQAFEKVVDRLLASPQYGERWGRHWLDVVRYADTAGCNSDFPAPDLYRYRNWVIQSFNNDKPYLDFLKEQIAGDLMKPANDEDRQGKIIATSYIALSRRFASSNNEHHLTIDDTIDNIGKGMLGLSISCAHCHDHKFDAIPERDYFALYGIFQSTIYSFPGVETTPRPYDSVALGGPEKQQQLSAWENQVKGVYAKIREYRFGEAKNRPNAKEEVEKLKAQVLAMELKPPDVARAYAVKEGVGKNARMQYKGDPKQLGEEVPRGWLTILGGQKLPPEEKGSGRLELAGWIADPGNPLTARVMANRIWLGHFGKGLVPTPNDFGVRGEAPTHPELLDWLTSRFAESGYSIKKMHKLIMLTRAYQLSSGHDAADFEKDPKNEFLWKFDRRRLEAEEIRDSMLAVSGQLDPTPGGPHPFPPVYQWSYSQHRQFFAVYDHNKRSVYLMQQRLRKNPILEVFDPADPNASTATRGSSVTALQALSEMNSEFIHTQSDQFAVRVGMAYDDIPGRIQFAYNLALGRPATVAEVREGSEYLARAKAALKDEVPAERKSRTALASLLRVLLSSDEFFFVD